MHTLPKLLLWPELAAGVEVFRRPKAAALLAGWHNSGRIKPGRALQSVTGDLEARVARRLAVGWQDLWASAKTYTLRPLAAIE